MKLERKKVIIVNPSMDIGGVETFLINLLRNIDRKKYDIVFLTYSSNKYAHQDEILSLGSRLIRVSHPKKVGVFKFVKEITKILREERPDVVHCNTHFNSVYVAIASKVAGVRNIVIHSHASYKKMRGNMTRRIRNRMSIYMINYLSNYQIAASPDASRSLFGNSKRAIIVKNGINVKSFVYSGVDRKAIRRRLSIPEHEQVIMHSARFHRDKNYEHLLNVFKRYLKTNVSSVLLLVGDGECRQEVERSIANKKLTDKVILVGFQTDTSAYYSTADVFLLPSHSEGLGIVLIEAQANGLHCVVSDGVPVDANVTGNINYLSLAAPIDAWVDAISQNIGKRDPSAYADVITKGYDAVDSVHVLEAIYDGVPKKQLINEN